MSGVGPVQSTSPPGMTSVAGNQSCNYSSQKFSNETPLHMHIQEPQFPSHMSTVDEDKCQEFTECFGQVQQAPVRTETKSSVVVLEDSKGNFISPVQPCLSPDWGITTFVGEICPVCGQKFMDKTSPDSL